MCLREDNTSRNDREVIHVESEVELEEILIPRLKERVFHVTSPEGYRGIMKDGAIKNNKNKAFPPSYSQSTRSWGREKGYVCLFDFRGVSDETIKGELRKGPFFNPPTAYDNPFFLVFSDTIYSKLISDEVAQQDQPYGMWIPYVECWYLGEIPTDLIEMVIEAKIETKPIENPKTLAQCLHNIHLKEKQEIRRNNASRTSEND